MLKKTALFAVFSLVILSFVTYGCGRSYDTSPWTLPTFTPLPTGNLYISASATYNSGGAVTAGTVTIQLTNASGAAVTGATVTMNGQAVNELGGGAYLTPNLTGLTPGTTVSLSISSASGSATGSIVMPALGGSSTGTISNGATGSTFAATSA